MPVAGVLLTIECNVSLAEAVLRAVVSLRRYVLICPGGAVAVVATCLLLSCPVCLKQNAGAVARAALSTAVAALVARRGGGLPTGYKSGGASSESQ